MVEFSPSKEYVLEEERFMQDESSEKKSVEVVKEAVFFWRANVCMVTSGTRVGLSVC